MFTFSEISMLIQQVNKVQEQLDKAFDVCELLRMRLGMDPNETPDLNEVPHNWIILVKLAH